jgi:hypothetical protein
MKKEFYYDISVGFFPIQVKLCFNNKSFFQVLSDYQINPPEDPKPLDVGVGETHCFNNQREMVVVVILNLDAMDNSTPAMVGVIAHESSHVVARVLEGIGEDVDDFGEETRAYLTEHLVQQMFIACVLELTKNAKRKEARAKARQKSARAGGTVPEVGQPGDDGGAGSTGDNQGKSNASRAKGRKGKTIKATGVYDRRVSKTRRYR